LRGLFLSLALALTTGIVGVTVNLRQRLRRAQFSQGLPGCGLSRGSLRVGCSWGWALNSCLNRGRVQVLIEIVLFQYWLDKRVLVLVSFLLLRRTDILLTLAATVAWLFGFFLSWFLHIPFWLISIFFVFFVARNESHMLDCVRLFGIIWFWRSMELRLIRRLVGTLNLGTSMAVAVNRNIKHY